MNDFRVDLRWSHDLEHDAMLERFYFNAFPHLERIEKVEDLERQRMGIDKILIMDGGHEYFVDEKKRRKYYGDILLEEYSNYERKTVGWLGRRKHVDFIVYAVIPTNTIYLLPFLFLQMAWVAHYRTWLDTYGRKLADNRSYHTSNIAVPTDVLLNAINEQMTQHWSLQNEQDKAA